MHLALPHLEQSASGRIVAITSLAAKEPTRISRSRTRFRPGAHRLSEDARRRARPARDHRQLRRARPHRHRPARAPLPGRPDRGGSSRRSRCAAGATRASSATSSASSRPIARATSPGRRSSSTAACRGRSSSVAGRHAGRSRRASLVALLLLAASCSTSSPSNDYLLLPDRAHPVAPLVRVQGGHDPTGPGGIYFVDVFERRASMFESLFPWIHTGATLVPANLIVPPGVSDNAARQADLREMYDLAEVAAAVALRRLGYKVVAKPSGVIVDEIDRRVTRSASSSRRPDRRRERRTDADDREPAHRAREGEAGRHGRRSRSTAACSTSRSAVKTIADPRTQSTRSSASRPSRRRRSSCRSRCRSTPATSAGRPRGSRSRSRCWRSSATGRPRLPRGRDGEIELNGAVGRSAASSRRRTACAQAKADVFLVPAGETRGGPALCPRASDHPCEEFSPGVASPGNTAAEALERSPSAAWKLPEIRQFSSAATLASTRIGPSIAASPRCPPSSARTNEQTSYSNVQ